jgi:hypothetical protein
MHACFSVSLPANSCCCGIVFLGCDGDGGHNPIRSTDTDPEYLRHLPGTNTHNMDRQTITEQRVEQAIRGKVAAVDAEWRTLH